jgi:hypothetical protein
MVQCRVCVRWYHRSCGGGSQAAAVDWVCKACDVVVTPPSVFKNDKLKYFKCGCPWGCSRPTYPSPSSTHRQFTGGREFFFFFGREFFYFFLF